MTSKTDEKSAKGILGQSAWEVLTNAASGGRIKAQQMKDIAWTLPTDREKDKVGGGHKRRMGEKDTSANETEMKNILMDWFQFGKSDLVSQY